MTKSGNEKGREKKEQGFQAEEFPQTQRRHHSRDTKTMGLSAGQLATKEGAAGAARTEKKQPEKGMEKKGHAPSFQAEEFPQSQRRDHSRGVNALGPSLSVEQLNAKEAARTKKKQLEHSTNQQVYQDFDAEPTTWPNAAGGGAATGSTVRRDESLRSEYPGAVPMPGEEPSRTPMRRTTMEGEDDNYSGGDTYGGGGEYLVTAEVVEDPERIEAPKPQPAIITFAEAQPAEVNNSDDDNNGEEAVWWRKAFCLGVGTATIIIVGLIIVVVVVVLPSSSDSDSPAEPQPSSEFDGTPNLVPTRAPVIHGYPTNHPVFLPTVSSSPDDTVESSSNPSQMPSVMPSFFPTPTSPTLPFTPAPTPFVSGDAPTPFPTTLPPTSPPTVSATSTPPPTPVVSGDPPTPFPTTSQPTPFPSETPSVLTTPPPSTTPPTTPPPSTTPPTTPPPSTTPPTTPPPSTTPPTTPPPSTTPPITPPPTTTPPTTPPPTTTPPTSAPLTTGPPTINEGSV